MPPKTISISEMIANAQTELSDHEKSALQINTIEELLLFTPTMLRRQDEAVFRGLHGTISHLELVGLHLSEEGSSILHNVTRVFGSLNAAPVAVLNFTVTGLDRFPTRHEPDRIVKILQRVSPPLTVRELVKMPATTLLSILRDQDVRESMVAFTRRLRSWGLVSSK